MSNRITPNASYYSLADFQRLHLQAIDSPDVLQADLDAFAYVHTQALMDGREGFFVDEFDDDMAAMIARHDGTVLK